MSLGGINTYYTINDTNKCNVKEIRIPTFAFNFYQNKIKI